MAAFPDGLCARLLFPALKKYDPAVFYGAFMRTRVSSFHKTNHPRGCTKFFPHEGTDSGQRLANSRWLQKRAAFGSMFATSPLGLHGTGLVARFCSALQMPQQQTAQKEVAAPAVAVAEARDSLDHFDGVWVFDRERSDSPEEQLAALGVCWWKRLAARRASPTVTIGTESGCGGSGVENAASVWRESITLPLIGSFYEKNEAMPLDGSPQHVKLHGFSIKRSTVVNQEANKVVTTTLVDGKHQGEISRHLIEDGDTYFVTSTLKFDDGKVVVKKSFFNRRKS